MAGDDDSIPAPPSARSHVTDPDGAPSMVSSTHENRRIRQSDMRFCCRRTAMDDVVELYWRERARPMPRQAPVRALDIAWQRKEPQFL